MSDSSPSPNDRSFSWPLRAMVISAAGILVSFGLCGAGSWLHGGGAESLAMAGVFVSILSVLGLVGSVVALVVVALIQGFRK